MDIGFNYKSLIISSYCQKNWKQKWMGDCGNVHNDAAKNISCRHLDWLSWMKPQLKPN